METADTSTPTPAATPARYASSDSRKSARSIERTTVRVMDGVHAAAPGGDDVPEVHGAHVAAPDDALDVPAAHAVHSPSEPSTPAV